LREDKPAAEVRRLVPKPASLISNANCCRSASAPASKARGKRLGRQPGQRPKSDRLTPKVLALVAEGRSYRLIGRELGLSKNTVVAMIKRNRAPSAES
jgi:DNA-binding NarL/FixJ family response regulator